MRISALSFVIAAASIALAPCAAVAQGKELPCVGYATFERDGPNTQLIGLAVGDIPEGAKVILKCSGTSCPFAEKEFNLTSSVKTLALTDMFIDPNFKAGTTLEIRVTKPGWVGKAFQYDIRSSGEPRSSTQCLSADGAKTVACAKETEAGHDK